MPVYKWSQTAASNASADPTVNYAEGQAPGSLNDSGRAEMAALKMYVDDIAGAIVTGGTSTAYTVASYSVYDTLAHLNGMMIAFTPHATNGATVTLNVDGLGAKPLRPSTGVELQSNVLIAGTPYMATYNNSDAVWYLHGIGGNSYGVPLLAGMDFWGTTAPSSAFAFPTGQAISRATYATAFALIGTTYGIGDGSTTFNLPDKTGRVSAMKEASATRLTTASGLIDGSTLGATGTASQGRNLSIANLDVFNFTPTGSATINTPLFPNQNISGSNVFTGVAAGNNGNTFQGNATNCVTGTITINQVTLGSGTAHSIVQPTIICNYILRII